MAAVGAGAAVDDDGVERVQVGLLRAGLSGRKVQGQLVLDVSQDLALRSPFAVVLEPEREQFATC